MTSIVTSPEDVINLALVRIGYKPSINNIFEGSDAANAALRIYSQTRDELLRSGNWGFAERNAPLTLIKAAPPGGYVPPINWSSQYPPLPWAFECIYPTDALDIRAVKRTPIFVPDYDPQPHQFSVDNDNSLAEPSKVLLCNVYPGVVVYTGQIENPIDWEPDFVEAFAATLGQRLAPVLVGLDPTKLAAVDVASSLNTAENVVG